MKLYFEKMEVSKIRRQVDLTGENFNRINFEEAEIIELHLSDKLSDSIEFEIWGTRLLMDDFWEHDKTFLHGVSHSDDYYVAGIGKIKIQQEIGIDMSFFPYAKMEDSYKFLRDETGKLVEESRIIGILKGSENYLWECVVICPHGFCRLNIYADGKVEYEFDDINMITEREFLKNPAKYAYHISNVQRLNL